MIGRFSRVSLAVEVDFTPFAQLRPESAIGGWMIFVLAY